MVSWLLKWTVGWLMGCIWFIALSMAKKSLEEFILTDENIVNIKKQEAFFFRKPLVFYRPILLFAYFFQEKL